MNPFKNISRFWANRTVLSSKSRHRRRRQGSLGTPQQLECRTLLTAVPVISAIGLVEDTGTSSTDMTTSNAAITGTVTYDGNSVEGITIEVDFDGDGQAETTAVTNASGEFTFDGSSQLTPGAVTINFRPVDPGMATGSWQQVSFTWAADPNDPAVVTQLALANDTGTSNSDMETSDATITGIVTNDGSVNMITVEIDMDGDGAADHMVQTNASGVFSYDATSELAAGNVTIQFRPVENDPFTGQPVNGAWQSINFVFEQELSMEAVGLNTTVGTFDDNVTTDGTVTGQVDGDGMLAGVTISIDIDGDGIADVTTTTDSNGDFILDLSSFISFGEVTVDVQVDNGLWIPLSFEYLE